MEPDVTEFKILKYLLGETRVDRIRTEYITERELQLDGLEIKQERQG